LHRPSEQPASRGGRSRGVSELDKQQLDRRLGVRAMEEQLSPVAVTHLLQHTLRSLCTGDAPPQWVYAVFWRILPRNYPPPKCVT
jgi:hypothetical protein